MFWGSDGGEVGDKGGNEQSSQFNIIFLKLIVKMYGSQIICLTLATDWCCSLSPKAVTRHTNFIHI